MSGSGKGDVTMLSKQYKGGFFCFTLCWDDLGGDPPSPQNRAESPPYNLTVSLFQWCKMSNCCMCIIDGFHFAAHQPRLQPITHTTTHILSLDNLCQTDCLL